MHRRSSIFSLLLVGLALFVTAYPASATRAWCHRDPIFIVAGTQISVDVAVYLDQQSYVTGPAVVTLYVPPKTSAKVSFTDSGFKGYGEKAVIAYDSHLQSTAHSLQVRVEVTIPSSIKMDSQSTVRPSAGNVMNVYGSTNKVMSLSTKIIPSK